MSYQDDNQSRSCYYNWVQHLALRNTIVKHSYRICCCESFSTLREWDLFCQLLWQLGGYCRFTSWQHLRSYQGLLTVHSWWPIPLLGRSLCSTDSATAPGTMAMYTSCSVTSEFPWLSSSYHQVQLLHCGLSGWAVLSLNTVKVVSGQMLYELVYRGGANCPALRSLVPLDAFALPTLLTAMQYTPKDPTRS